MSFKMIKNLMTYIAIDRSLEISKDCTQNSCRYPVVGIVSSRIDFQKASL